MKGDLSQTRLSASADAEPPGDCCVSSCFSVDQRLFGRSVFNLLKERRFVAGVPDRVTDEVVSYLGHLNGDCVSEAWAINRQGQVVGDSFSCGSTFQHHAFLWED